MNNNELIEKVAEWLWNNYKSNDMMAWDKMVKYAERGIYGKKPIAAEFRTKARELLKLIPLDEIAGEANELLNRIPLIKDKKVREYIAKPIDNIFSLLSTEPASDSEPVDEPDEPTTTIADEIREIVEELKKRNTLNDGHRHKNL